MRIVTSQHGTKIWLSRDETYNWAQKTGAAWPCSFLSSKRLFAEFASNGDLIDIAINGGKGDQDCPSDELTAIIEDHIGTASPLTK